MADYPNHDDDPKLQGYIPLEYVRLTDVDKSSRKIRNMSRDNIITSGSIFDFNVDVEIPNLLDDWNENDG